MSAKRSKPDILQPDFWVC